MYVPLNFQEKKKKSYSIKTGAVRCHFKSFSINLLLKFPFKGGVTDGEAQFVKAAKEKAFPHI